MRRVIEGLLLCIGLVCIVVALCGCKTGGSGSCPFIFLYDEGTYRYVGDLSGSPLGKGLPFFKPQFYGLNIYSLGDWKPDRQQIYRMRLRELAFEASYFDYAALAVVDVPAGYSVYNEWSSTPQIDQHPSRRYVTVHDPRPPLSAVTDSGRDVLRQISAADDVPVPVEQSLTRVVVDFGRVEHPERARLVVTTWGAYGDYRDELKPPYSAGTVIETLDEQGQWKERVVAGKSAADSKTWALDLAGALQGGDGRVRITMAHQVSTIDLLDQVLLDDSDQVPFTLTRVAPTVAAFSYSGASTVHEPTVEHRALVEDDNHAPGDEALLNGNYTRYGDVLPLLAAADDRFVLMANGDQLELEFGAPPQAAGTSRRVFLEADVFYTLKYHPFGQLTDSIDPLPFHGMKSYPYAPEEWPYRDDADYQKYLTEWNTRPIVVR
jgi:hypothetical protein